MATNVFTMKGRVATEPFPDMSTKTTVNKTGGGAVGVAKIENRTGLVALKVLFGTEDGRFGAGDLVYVQGKNYTLPWAKEVHQLFGDKSFILIPDTFIEMAIRNGV